MKLETKTAFAAYVHYGGGGGTHRVGNFYPIRSAADVAFKKSSERNCYFSGAHKETLLVIDDEYYVLEKNPISRKDHVKADCLAELKIECVLCNTSPANLWSHELNYRFFDQKAAWDFVMAENGKNIQLFGCHVIKDEEFVYILKSDTPVILEKIMMSRDLVIAEALGKLNDEEKSLLGLK
jgi:hypothetical protein